MDRRGAQIQVRDLLATLTVMHDRDPEQEVRGIALAPLDQLLNEVRPFIGSDAVIASIRDVISPEMIEEGGEVRVADLMVLLTMIQGRIGKPATVTSW